MHICVSDIHHHLFMWDVKAIIAHQSYPTKTYVAWNDQLTFVQNGSHKLSKISKIPINVNENTRCIIWWMMWICQTTDNQFIFNILHSTKPGANLAIKIQRQNPRGLTRNFEHGLWLVGSTAASQPEAENSSQPIRISKWIFYLWYRPQLRMCTTLYMNIPVRNQNKITLGNNNKMPIWFWGKTNWTDDTVKGC